MKDIRKWGERFGVELADTGNEKIHEYLSYRDDTIQGNAYDEWSEDERKTFIRTALKRMAEDL